MFNLRDELMSVLRVRCALKDHDVQAIRDTQEKGASLAEALTFTIGMSARDIAIALSEYYKMPFVDLEDLKIANAAFKLSSQALSRETYSFPISYDEGAIRFAVSDPGHFFCLDDLKWSYDKYDISYCVAPYDQILRLIYIGLTGENLPADMDVSRVCLTRDPGSTDGPSDSLCIHKDGLVIYNNNRNCDNISARRGFLSPRFLYMIAKYIKKYDLHLLNECYPVVGWMPHCASRSISFIQSNQEFSIKNTACEGPVELWFLEAAMIDLLQEVRYF